MRSSAGSNKKSTITVGLLDCREVSRSTIDLRKLSQKRSRCFRKKPRRSSRANSARLFRTGSEKLRRITRHSTLPNCRQVRRKSCLGSSPNRRRNKKVRAMESWTLLEAANWISGPS
ncbi:MAG: hypothetical protein ACK55Z_21075, partial [bacterium]